MLRKVKKKGDIRFGKTLFVTKKRGFDCSSILGWKGGKEGNQKKGGDTFLEVPERGRVEKRPLGI